jgi:hypothetical protein
MSRKLSLCNPNPKFRYRNIFSLVTWVRVRLSALGKLAITWSILPAPDGSGAVGGMIGKGNWSTHRKHAPSPLCAPQITHHLTRDTAFFSIIICSSKYLDRKYKKTKPNKLHGLSPRANYTDRAIAACRRSDTDINLITSETEWKF